VQGPPGTGKSQTIATVIAQSVAAGVFQPPSRMTIGGPVVSQVGPEPGVTNAFAGPPRNSMRNRESQQPSAPSRGMCFSTSAHG
jgi:hypothetical protein